MFNEQVMLRCGNCGARNRVAKTRLNEHPVCGKCKNPLPADHPYPMRVLEVSDSSFYLEVYGFPGSVVANFYSTSCPHCRTLAPVLDALAKDYAGKIKFVKVNTERNPMVAGQLNVLGLPTLILFKKGEKVHRIDGALPRQHLEQQLSVLL